MNHGMIRSQRIALVSPGDGEARQNANLNEHRLNRVAEALRAVVLEPELAIYNDDFADEVFDQLIGVDAVLVWVNPIEGGRDRTKLDAMLEQVAARGVLVSARHAARGSVEQEMPLVEFFEICEPYLADWGQVIDQAYQERLTDGMVRCYLVGDRVAGFGRQEINALFPAPEGASGDQAPQPGPRLYHPPTSLEFQAVRQKMESEWLPEMLRTLSIGIEELPLLWDADFYYGPMDASGEDTYVLGEINVSSVYPFPDDALGPLADAVRARLA